jgi:hypothetical protein
MSAMPAPQHRDDAGGRRIYFYQCIGCGTVLRPKAGDCCVFCSYGPIRCPPAQEANTCCTILTSP